MAKRYHSVLDAEGQQFLGFLTEGGRRLATLIDDLLAYTRAGLMRAAADYGGCLGGCLKQAFSSLAEAIRQCNGKRDL